MVWVWVKGFIENLGTGALAVYLIFNIRETPFQITQVRFTGYRLSLTGLTQSVSPNSIRNTM